MRGVTIVYTHLRDEEPETQVTGVATPRSLRRWGQDLNPGWRLRSLELCSAGSECPMYLQELSDKGDSRVCEGVGSAGTNPAGPRCESAPLLLTVGPHL